MIYNIYSKDDLIVETDSIDLVKSIIKKKPGCSVKNALTGKEFVIKTVQKPKEQALMASAAGPATNPAAP